MTFEWALAELKEGKKVWRKSWYTPWSKLQNYFWVDRGVLSGLFSHRLGWDDFIAEDWEEYISTKNHKSIVENEVSWPMHQNPSGM